MKTSLSFFAASLALLGSLLAVPTLAVAADKDNLLNHPEFKKAITAYTENRLDTSKHILEKLAQKFPDNPSILNNLAVIAQRQANTELAVNLLKRIMATDTSINTGYQNLSAIYAHLASLSYQEALSLELTDQQPLKLTFIGKEKTTTPIKTNVATQVAQAKDINKPLVQDPKSPTLDNQNRDIVYAVKHWAQAWSKQDLSAYFTSYINDYAPLDNSHQNWKKQRTERIVTPRYIEVTLSDIRILTNQKNDAQITFRQKYQSNLLSSLVIKRLHMRNINNEWKIALEKVL